MREQLALATRRWVDKFHSGRRAMNSVGVHRRRLPITLTAILLTYSRTHVDD